MASRAYTLPLARIRSAWASFCNLFRRHGIAAAAPVADPGPPAPVIHIEHAPSADQPEIGVNCERDIHHILDALPEYFEDMRALRKLDESAYGIFSSLGGTIIGDDAVFSLKVDPEFVNEAPAVRCFFFGKYMDCGDNCIRSIYMMRMAPSQLIVTHEGCVVTPRTGLSYRLVLVWRIKGKKWAAAGECFVNIAEDGSVRALPEKRRAMQRLPRGERFIRARTGIPSWVGELAREKGEPTEKWIAGVVSLCASAKRPSEAILVRAHKGGTAAAWAIDRRDAKRFFRERVGGRTSGGSRKKVLHYVAQFQRVTGGKTTTVREHYRGEREFEWNGYQVAVSGLGFHHKDFFDARIQGHSDTEDEGPRAGMISLSRAAKLIARQYNRPHFLSPRRKAA